MAERLLLADPSTGRISTTYNLRVLRSVGPNKYLHFDSVMLNSAFGTCFEVVGYLAMLRVSEVGIAPGHRLYGRGI
jgi:hypothetical protein